MDWKSIILDLRRVGMTQQQIAAACETGQSHISSLERGVRQCPRWDLGERLRKLHEEKCGRLDAENVDAEECAPTAISKAIADAGGMKAVAEHCGVSVQAVHKWIKAGMPPAERCLDLERLCKGAVSRYELRPDVFGERPQQEAA